MFSKSFEITTENINSLPKTDWFDFPTAGAAVTFEGRVRNHNDGRNVSFLEYQTYEEMSVKVGNTILKNALDRFDITAVKCIHRYGKLKIGDIAVWVVAVSSHRRESFEACQYVIDTIKDELPMWKKEHYTEGTYEWVACHRCLEHSHKKHNE